MAEEIKVGCTRPTGGLVGEPAEPKEESLSKTVEQEVPNMFRWEKSPGLHGTRLSEREIHFRETFRISRKMGRALFLSG